MSEGMLVSMLAVLCTSISGFVIAARMNLRLLSEPERYCLPLLGGALFSWVGAMLGVVLYNVPLFVFGVIVGVGMTFFAVHCGLARNNTR